MADQEKKNFFQKHPGFDLYSLFWLAIVVIFVSLGRFYLPLLLPALVALVYLIFRLLSRNAPNRQVENARFQALIRALFQWFGKKKRTMQPDKEHYYFKCPTCGQPMRIPRGLGTVKITCRNCQAQFEATS